MEAMFRIVYPDRNMASPSSQVFYYRGTNQPGSRNDAVNHPKAIYVHHSASAESTSVEEITRWHAARGFRTIGYHKVINLKGGVVVTHEGRRETEVGAHTQGHNTDSLGVCVAGNYSVNEMKAPVYEELLDVVGALMRRYGIPASQVFGHREAEGAASECPGLRFDLKKLRADLALRA